MKKVFVIIISTFFYTYVKCQTIGSRVSFPATDGKTYTGVIKDIQGNSFKIKYDGFEYESWLMANQFSVIGHSPNTNYTSPSQTEILAGTKISFYGTDGKKYTAIITEKQGNSYKIKYDGYDFTAWIKREQFTIEKVAVNTTTYNQPAQQTTTQPPLYNGPIKSGVTGLNEILEFGRKQGWASQVQLHSLNNYARQLTPQDKNKIVQFINQAKTNSAKFFVLKSLLAGDDFTVLQKFINQLNKYPESYQQQKCLVTTRNSIIQQWQQTCSVTSIQTFLGDLCPRYAWDVKQIANFDAIANNPNHPMAVQQKELLEKYGGSVSARGIIAGKEIGLNEPLNDFVGKILGVRFAAEQITEPLSAALGKVRNQLDRGINVPLNIKFLGTEARHFLLVMKYRNTANGYQYLIYDPWDGVCDYVSESSLIQGSLSPLNNQWRISVDYYYPAS